MDNHQAPRFCPSCGMPLRPGLAFCTSCGAAVPGLEPPQLAVQPPQPSWVQPTSQTEQELEDIPPSSTLRSVELLRRAIAVFAIFVGTVALSYPRQMVFEIETLDLGASYLKNQKSIPIGAHLIKSLAAEDTAPISVERKDWFELRDRVLKSTIPRKYESRGPRLVFGQEEPMLTALGPELLDKSRWQPNWGHRLVVVRDGLAIRYLTVNRILKPSSSDLLPWTFLYPYWYHSIWALVVGILAYVLVRWRPKQDLEPVYYRAWVAAAADLIGLLVMVPAALVCSIALAGESSAIFGTIGIALLAMVFLIMGTYYSTLRAQCLQDRIRVLSLFGQTDFPFHRIRSSVLQRERQSPVLAVMLIMMGVTNCLSAIGGIIMLVRKHPRYTLVRDDGKKFQIWVDSSRGVRDRLIQHLTYGGVESHISDL